MWPIPHFFLIFAISPKIQVCKTGLGCNRRFEALFHDIKVENKWIIHKNCKFPAQWLGPCRYCANFFGQKAPSHQKIWIKKIVSNARLFPFLQQNSGDIISRKCFRLFGFNIFAPWYLDDWVKWCEQGSISDGINGAPDILILNQCQAHIFPHKCAHRPLPGRDRHKCPIIDVRSEDICTTSIIHGSGSGDGGGIML